MGIISKFSDIMNANVNAVLAKAEEKNADKLLAKYIADAKDSLGQIKAETAAVIAEETACGRKLSECRNTVAKYENYAVAAVKAGNDDDARQFLTYKQQEEAKLSDLEKNYELAKANSEKMRQMTKKLTEDINAAQGKMKELQAKLNVAKEQEKLNALNEKLGKTSLSDTDSLFEAVQKRIDAADARAQLDADLNDEKNIKDLEAKYADAEKNSDSPSVEDELAKLKASL